MAWPEPLTLHADYCKLVPLSHDHHDALVEAVQDGELWNPCYSAVPKPSEMRREIDRRLELQKKNAMVPFVVIHNETNQAVGMTTYCQIDSMNKRLDIGFTWYAKRHQKTALNTTCKLMLLTHAFKRLNV